MSPFLIVSLWSYSSFAGLGVVPFNGLSNQPGIFVGFINPPKGKIKCPSKSEVASVTIAFEYDGALRLRGTKGDGQALDQMAKHFSDRTKLIRDGAAATKADFLLQLQLAARDRRYLNINFSAHGENINGTYYLVLPGATKCLGLASDGSYSERRGISQILNGANISKSESSAAPQEPIDSSQVMAKALKKCREFFVSAQEMRKALRGKFLFGLNLSCMSGPMKKIAKAALITAAGDTQTDVDVAAVNPKWGPMSALGDQIGDLISDQKSCPGDLASGAKIYFSDLATVLNGTQGQGAGASGFERSELGCFSIATVREGCGKLRINPEPAPNLETPKVSK